MWLFTRYGFFRVAWYGREFGVCARTRFHLEALLARFPHLGRGRRGKPGAQIIENLQADYRWRIMVPRRTWVAVMSELAEEQDWQKFKPEVERVNGHGAYYEACLQVWGVMYGVQCQDVTEDMRNQAEDRAMAAGEAGLAEQDLAEARLPGWDELEELSDDVPPRPIRLKETPIYDWPDPEVES